MILSPSESEGLRFLLKIWIWAPTGPSRLRQLAIGTLLASRVPIQVDAKHISGGGLGGTWGSTWPLGAGSLVLGALVYQHEPDPEGHRPPTMKKTRLGIDQKFVMVDREPFCNEKESVV